MSKANRFELEVVYSTDKKISEEQVVARLIRSLKKDDDDGWVVIAPLKTPPSTDDMPAAFQNEPVTFLLSNALRHLTQDQQRQLCNALLERLPTPASLEQEANRLYPHPQETYISPDGVTKMYSNDNKCKAEGYITAARQYMGEIDKLNARVKELEEHLKNIYEMYGDEWTNYAQEWTEKVLKITQP